MAFWNRNRREEKIDEQIIEEDEQEWFLGEALEDTDPSCKPKVGQPTPVVCVQTGKEYSSIKEAARDTGISSTSISRSKRLGVTVKGYNFMGIEE